MSFFSVLTRMHDARESCTVALIVVQESNEWSSFFWALQQMAENSDPLEGVSLLKICLKKRARGLLDKLNFHIETPWWTKENKDNKIDRVRKRREEVSEKIKIEREGRMRWILFPFAWNLFSRGFQTFPVSTPGHRSQICKIKFTFTFSYVKAGENYNFSKTKITKNVVRVVDAKMLCNSVSSFALVKGQFVPLVLSTQPEMVTGL